MHTHLSELFEWEARSEHPILPCTPPFAAPTLLTWSQVADLIYIYMYTYNDVPASQFPNIDHHGGISSQITIIPKPELRACWVDFLAKPPFGVTTRP